MDRLGVTLPHPTVSGVLLMILRASLGQLWVSFSAWHAGPYVATVGRRLQQGSPL